jgi:hypothetical protein
MTQNNRERLSSSLSAEFLIIAAVSVSWIVVVFVNNQILFRWTALDSWLHLIYLAAGYKLLIIMLFGFKGAVGIFVGTIYNFFDIFPFLPSGSILALAALYAAAPLAACHVFESLSGRHYPWTNLRFADLIKLSLLTSTSSSLSLVIGLWIVSGTYFGIQSILYLIIGDLTGILIFFLMIAACIKFFGRFGIINV